MPSIQEGYFEISLAVAAIIDLQWGGGLQGRYRRLVFQAISVETHYKLHHTFLKLNSS